jgi:hypothetical protein
MQKMIKLQRLFSVYGLVFAALHFGILCWLYIHQPTEQNNMQFVPLVIPDLPATLLVYCLNYLFGINFAWPVFFAVGTLWWYFLGVLFKRYVIR